MIHNGEKQKSHIEWKKERKLFKVTQMFLTKEFFFLSVLQHHLHYFVLFPLSKFNEWKMWIFKRFEFLFDRSQPI